MRRGASLAGGLMVCGTTSDAGKTTVVTGLCRLLARRGLSVAPFKAQNMALNSAVTAGGQEIGRAQYAQAQAAGVPAEAAMNPILLKPQSDRTSQVVVMGRPWKTLDAAAYHRAKGQLRGVVAEQLEDLRRRFDVVICEGAGSPAEINLLDGDIVNLPLAKAASLPAVVVGDIDRGGVFAALYGTVALLPAELRPLVRGFIVNKFRGDPALLAAGPAELERRTGVPTLGVLPWMDGLGVDAEDSLALSSAWRAGGRAPSPPGADGLDVAVVRLPRISNFTDLDALAAEPGVTVRLVDSAAGLGRPDLVVLPGTKATVADLAWLRERGLADALAGLAGAAGEDSTILGICGGYQMLGRRVRDPGVEERAPASVEGLGLLAVETEMRADKVTRACGGFALGERVAGYEIRHGRTYPSGAAAAVPAGEGPWMTLDGPGGAAAEGFSAGGGRVLGTSVHGLFESDAFRERFLAAVAARAGRSWRPGGVRFAAERAARFDRLADALEEHVDVAGIERLIEASARRAPEVPR